MLDKYKVAAEIKKNNPEIMHKEAMELSKEAVKIYFEDNCTADEAIEKAKEILGAD
ncbi:hypothetical protein [Tissierella praeacuta]|uniref:hypothetical protein n=1 Tax=Tissierella praeacuta TaxID=43131 RepID=UPI003340F037